MEAPRNDWYWLTVDAAQLDTLKRTHAPQVVRVGTEGTYQAGYATEGDQQAARATLTAQVA